MRSDAPGPAGTLPEKLDFEGAHNFRDMGGYTLADGRRVRRGRIFRSDHLGRLTDRDQELLEQVGIRTVVDLRRAEEREEIMDRIDNTAVRQVWLPVQAKGADVVNIRRAIERAEVSAENARGFLVQANRQFATVLSGVFRDFLHLLLEPDAYPLVFHCSAGKDRAGFAAAMTLYALGASDQTVMHDYLATNHCTANYVEELVDGLGDFQLDMAADALRHLMRADPGYLGAALDTVGSEHGGVEAFLHGPLDFGPAKREQLRALLAH